MTDLFPIIGILLLGIVVGAFGKICTMAIRKKVSIRDAFWIWVKEIKDEARSK